MLQYVIEKEVQALGKNTKRYVLGPLEDANLSSQLKGAFPNEPYAENPSDSSHISMEKKRKL